MEMNQIRTPAWRSFSFPVLTRRSLEQNDRRPIPPFSLRAVLVDCPEMRSWGINSSDDAGAPWPDTIDRSTDHAMVCDSDSLCGLASEFAPPWKRPRVATSDSRHQPLMAPPMTHQFPGEIRTDVSRVPSWQSCPSRHQGLPSPTSTVSSGGSQHNPSTPSSYFRALNNTTTSKNTMLVSSLMIPADHVVKCTSWDAVHTIMDAILERNISAVVVMDDHDPLKPVGIVTKTDLVRAYQQGISLYAKVGVIMQRHLHTLPVSFHSLDEVKPASAVHEIPTVEEAAAMMAHDRVHHAIFVQSETGHLFGLLSAWDVAAACASSHSTDQASVEPTNATTMKPIWGHYHHHQKPLHTTEPARTHMMEA